MLASTISPFKPGFGTTPLHTAGRDEEQEIINKALVAITQPCSDGVLAEASDGIIKIVGPRGVGKTVMLCLARDKVKELAAANEGIGEEQGREVFDWLWDNSLIWFAEDFEVRAAILSFFKYFRDMQKMST